MGSIVNDQTGENQVSEIDSLDLQLQITIQFHRSTISHSIKTEKLFGFLNCISLCTIDSQIRPL
jgi:hypothetical protein